VKLQSDIKAFFRFSFYWETLQFPKLPRTDIKQFFKKDMEDCEQKIPVHGNVRSAVA
jgi:hypothetical protein